MPLSTRPHGLRIQRHTSTIAMATSDHPTIRSHQLFDRQLEYCHGPIDHEPSGSGHRFWKEPLKSFPEMPELPPVTAVRDDERTVSRAISAAAIVTIAR